MKMMSITKTPVLFLLFIFLFLSSPLLSFSITSDISHDLEVGDESSFTYEEGTINGPKNWGKINPHWSLCNNGSLQSPIDLGIDGRVQIVPHLGKLKRNYKPALASLKNRGHDIAIFFKGDAGHITINETDYKLQQCHWHSPSEHTFNGSRFVMELHIVHSSSNGKIAVVGITYKYGRPDPFLAKQVIPHLGSIEDHESDEDIEERDVGIVNPGNIKFGSRKYFRYIGSLTTPPCTEGVAWTIMKKVRTVSREQVRVLREAVHDGFEENARPTQKDEGRTILMYSPS